MSKFCSYLGALPGRTGGRADVTRALAVALALCTLLALWTLFLLRDPTPRFLERRSELARWIEGPSERAAGHEIQTVRLVASSGLEVELLVKRPVGDVRTPVRRPVILIAGGHRTGREAARL